MKFISILVFAFFILSCSTNKVESPQQNSISTKHYSLQPKDTVSIEIDSTTSNFYPYFQYKEINNQKVLAVYNSNEHRIQLYDLSKQNHLINIKFSKEGENPIPEVFGFLIHSFDSIFLFTINRNEILLVDSLGIIKDKFLVTDNLNRKVGYEASVDEFFDPTFDAESNLITFWIKPLIDNETPDYYQFPLAVDYSLVEKRIIRNYGYFPDSYREDDLYFLRDKLQRLRTPQYDIHYFEASHELYLYDLSSKDLVKTVFVKSNFLPNQIPSSTHTGEESLPLQKQRNYNITDGRYNRLLYDRGNRIFYRVVRHSQELLASDGLMNGKLTNTLSLIIANQDFEILGEQELPANVFMDYFSFVSDGQLWININHPNNALNNEGLLQFIVFEPVKQ